MTDLEKELTSELAAASTLLPDWVQILDKVLGEHRSPDMELSPAFLWLFCVANHPFSGPWVILDAARIVQRRLT